MHNGRVFKHLPMDPAEYSETSLDVPGMCENTPSYLDATKSSLLTTRSLSIILLEMPFFVFAPFFFLVFSVV